MFDPESVSHIAHVAARPGWPFASSGYGKVRSSLRTWHCVSGRPAEYQAAVRSAKTKGVRYHHVDLGVPGFVRHVIQVAFRVGVVQVDRGRQHLVADGENREYGLGHARSAEQVTRHGFSRAHGELTGGITERALDRDGFADIAGRRRGAVRIQVINI